MTYEVRGGIHMLWKCTVCGMQVEGELAPEFCPKCGAPREKFIAITEEETEKIYKSLRTNDIHMEISNLCDAIIDLADEGSEINLDPGCLSVFENATKEAWIIKNRSKAEIQAHIAKGKW